MAHFTCAITSPVIQYIKQINISAAFDLSSTDPSSGYICFDSSGTYFWGVGTWRGASAGFLWVTVCAANTAWHSRQIKRLVSSGGLEDSALPLTPLCDERPVSCRAVTVTEDKGAGFTTGGRALSVGDRRAYHCSHRAPCRSEDSHETPGRTSLKIEALGTEWWDTYHLRKWMEKFEASEGCLLVFTYKQAQIPGLPLFFHPSWECDVPLKNTAESSRAVVMHQSNVTAALTKRRQIRKLKQHFWIEAKNLSVCMSAPATWKGLVAHSHIVSALFLTRGRCF